MTTTAEKYKKFYSVKGDEVIAQNKDKINKKISLTAIALALMVSISAPVMAQRVVSAVCDQVIDGDTFYLKFEDEMDREKARLAGIDAPEPRQRTGSKAKANLKVLMYGKKLEVTILGRDRETENLIVLVDAEGIDPTRTQCKQGLAWINPDDIDLIPKEKLDDYDNLIYEAQVNHWGLWSDRKAEPPWVFRATQKIYNR